MPIDEKTAYVIKVANNFKLTYQDHIGLIPEYINTIGRILHPFVYLILQWHMLSSSKAKKLKTKDFKLYNWLYKLTLFQSIYTLSLLATIMLNIVFETANVNQFLELIPTILTITFFFTISGYLLWHQDLLRRLKYVNLSPLSQDLSNITKRIKLEKYFIDPHLNIEKLSDLLTINSKDLSQLIRQDYSNFNKWINSVRIEYSLELLKEGYLNQYSVEALSEAAGFKSKNTFYRAFKEITNTTPIKYMKDNSEPLHAT
jgi:AraC-like DNA-binding protein